MEFKKKASRNSMLFRLLCTCKPGSAIIAQNPNQTDLARRGLDNDRRYQMSQMWF